MHKQGVRCTSECGFKANHIPMYGMWGVEGTKGANIEADQTLREVHVAVIVCDALQQHLDALWSAVYRELKFNQTKS